MTKPKRIGRRQVLLGMGGAVLAIPALPSLFGPNEARAGAGPAVNRNFITYRVTNGFFGHQWYPTDAAAAGLTLVEPNVREMNLADIEGPISPILDERFDPLREKLVLMRHIDRMDKGDHQAGNGLFGWGTGTDGLTGIDVASLPPSIDKLIAEKAYGGAFLPLNLGVRWSQTGSSCSFSTTGQGEAVMEPSLYPDQAFQSLFVGLDVDDLTAERLRQQQITLVDRSLEHYHAVRNNSRLSAADKDVLDEHIQHMQQVEQLLQNGTIDCTPPDDPGGWQGTPENVNPAAQAQIDIAVAALKCGLTRVVNFYLDPDVLMNESIHGVTGGHHGASHDTSPVSVDSILAAHRWHMNYFADLLEKLEASQNLDGSTLLDDSLVLLNNEIGNQSGSAGNDPNQLDTNHIGVDSQTLLAGSCGGRLRTGLFLDYRTDHTRNRWTQYIGTAYNWVLVSCMIAMGLEPEDWEVDGQPGYGDLRGGLYDQTPPDKVIIGDQRSIMPRLEATS